jgi:hypothetical protein
LAALTTLLYRGQQVSDDHTLHGPRNWFSGMFLSDDRNSRWQRGGWADIFCNGLGIDPEAIVIIIAIFLVLGGVWLLFEVAFPVIVFLLYLVPRGMLARVANDCHQCRGRLGRAVCWGLVWATVYTAPLAVAVWYAHVAHQREFPGE